MFLVKRVKIKERLLVTINKDIVIFLIFKN